MTINVILAFMIIVSFLISIVLHEVGHSLMATWLGDPTARAEGRLSFSLRSHLDPLGTMLCVILAFFPVLIGLTGLAAAPLGMGWGKPVKPDPWKLRGGPNAGTLLVALGGIFMNIIVGVLAAIVLRLLPSSFGGNLLIIRIPQFILTFASVNFCLAIFNLIPLYPLDGYQILYTLLPNRQAVSFSRSATYGPFIILLIIFLLPFLGQFSGLSSFPLFRISYYILLGALKLVSLASGVDFGEVQFLYAF
ncbi:MAG TPA: site-2 protease family protein [Ktedonobacteraceae bacterium]